MRVLLAARHPPQGRLKIGGVQSWMATVAAELDRLGHFVECWGPEFAPPAGRFDVGILANLGDTRRADQWCDKVLAISHGIIGPERPPTDIPVAFTSEGVRDHWHGTGPIIRQPIDLQFWSPDGRERSGMLRYSYRNGLDFLPDVAKRLKMGFTHLGDVAPAVARDAMRGAAVVLASGRAAVESAACGAPVVICDDRGYQAPLLAPFCGWQMRCNYSGRGGIEPTPGHVLDCVRDALECGSDRAHVEAHHDVRQVVAELLQAAGVGVESGA